MFLLALPLLVLSPAQAASAPAASAPAVRSPLERVAIIGASLSDGFGLNAELEVPVRLGVVWSSFVAHALPAALDLGNSRFFLRPHSYGAKMVGEALEYEPTLVLALDFLFWYAHGIKEEDQRLRELELGLRELERFSCPVVIADLPDVSRALEGVGPFGMPMIVREQIPAAATLERMNERLAAWAAERESVTLVALSGLMTPGEVAVRARRWDSYEELLQKDLLHPNLDGTIVLLIKVADALSKEHDTLSPADFLYDIPIVKKRLRLATEDERERAMELKQRREERRKRAEERRKAREKEKAGADSGG